MSFALHSRIEHWPLVRPFSIARGTRTEAVTLVVELARDGCVGRGESVPYARYDESPQSVLAQVDGLHADGLELDRESLAKRLPAGAARNAIDCALWDWEAKRQGQPVWQLAGLPKPKPLTTAFTVGLGTPEEMGTAAGQAKDRPLLKVKLGGDAANEPARIRAVRKAAPDARLVVDANEGWTLETAQGMAPVLAECGVELLEQPFPAAEDSQVAKLPKTTPLCADESCHTRDGLGQIAELYQFANVKLDKAGGFTEALALCHAVKERGLGLFVGCMLAGSLATAPALLLAGLADYVDLDGPLYIKHDRFGGIRYEESLLHPASSNLWG